MNVTQTSINPVCLAPVCLALACLAVAYLAVAVPGADAQPLAPDSPDVEQPQDVDELRRRAMDAYHALDIDAALGMLRRARAIARSGRADGQQRARIALSLGVVHAAGLGDAVAGRRHMLEAVCLDGAIAHDVLVATPALEDLLRAAGMDARQGGCGAAGQAPTTLATPTTPTTPTTRLVWPPAEEIELPPALQPKVPTGQPLSDASVGVVIQLGPAIGLGLIDAGMPADRRAAGLAQDDPRACCVQINRAGLTPHGALRAALGLQINDALLLSTVARLQLRRGEGSWAGVLLGGRVEVFPWGSGGRDTSVSLFAGATAGRLNVQPATGDSPVYATSGMAGAHVGTTVRVPMGPRLAFVVAPELDLQFPDVMWNMDVMTGVELRP